MDSKQKIYLELLRVGTIHVRNKLAREGSPALAVDSAAKIAELLHGIPPLILEPSVRGDIYFLHHAVGPFALAYPDTNDAAFGPLCSLILELEHEVQKESPFPWELPSKAADILKRFKKVNSKA